MRTHWLLVALLAIALLGIGFIWWMRLSVPPLQQTFFAIHPAIVAPESTPIVPTASPKKQLPGGPYEASDPRWADVNAKDKIDRIWEWKKPINFYGRVVDQDDNPIAGAMVH